LNTRQDQAIEYFDSGFNCAQSVLSVFCENYGLSKEMARKIACGLGGGCRSGEVCGAASGAVIVVGLKYGHNQADDVKSKKNCYAKTVELLDAFRVENRSVVCRDILGFDISTEEGSKQAQSRNLFKTVCFDMVKSAVSILENSGY